MPSRDEIIGNVNITPLTGNGSRTSFSDVTVSNHRGPDISACNFYGITLRNGSYSNVSKSGRICFTNRGNRLYFVDPEEAGIRGYRIQTLNGRNKPEDNRYINLSQVKTCDRLKAYLGDHKLLKDQESGLYYILKEAPLDEDDDR